MATTPIEPEGRGLLLDKSVVVTAAAGTGIGSAVAKRALIEGARVLISDIHERRLGETADRLEEETGRRPTTAVCDVTVEEDVTRLVDAAVEGHGGIDVMMNNAGLGGSVRLGQSYPGGDLGLDDGHHRRWSFRGRGRSKIGQRRRPRNVR